MQGTSEIGEDDEEQQQQQHRRVVKFRAQIMMEWDME